MSNLGLPAVAICGGIGVIGNVLVVIIAIAILVAPVGVFSSGI
jgi:hypothetical protein